MQTKWKKIALLTAPLLIGGTVYALAADGTPAKPVASASETSSNISYQVVKSEPLSTEEMQQLEQAKLTPQTTAASGGVTDSSLDPMNPFVVHSADANTAASAPASASGTTTATTAQTNPTDQFDLSNVKNFEWKTMTSQGELKLQFKNEGGKLKLEGDLAGRKIDVEGDKAVQVLSQLLQNSNLNSALTATLQGKQVSLDSSVLQSIEDLKVELQDGRHIESQPHGNNPKEQGKHDNGLHKGQTKEKDKAEHGKGKKGHDE